MKTNQLLRQNQKVVRHSVHAKKFRIPDARKRTEKVLGKVLPVVPGVSKLLADIRKEFNIPLIEPGDRLEDFIESEDEIDWKAVRKELEARLRKLPDILPRELARYQKAMDAKKKLPKTLRFTEPITQKLKIDVRMLYKGFVKLYSLATDNLALPWIKAADNFFTAATDNLIEFLKTGIAQEVPSDWINAVQTVPFFGENVVIVMAGELSDPEEVAEFFQKEFAKTFKRRKPKFTKTDAAIAEYLVMRLEGSAYKDIAYEYIQRHPDEFPDDPESEKYRVAKEKLEDTLKHSIRNALDRLDDKAGDKK
ncbi:MAG: hypothetical protein HY022_00915 [Chloroflexi bacterium]|nr:hypothetical protein [Chloroflexota bacterium]